MNRPVSVISPTYSASAIDCVGVTSRAPISPQMISAVQEACGSTRLTVPKWVLSWWWSMLTICIPSRRSASAALRSRFPQSRNTTVRSSTSAGGEVISPGGARNRYSLGSGRSRSPTNGLLSLPSAVRISCIAASEPSASPSGFSWVTTISLSAERSAPSTCSRFELDPFSVICRLPQQFVDPRGVVDRVVVLERQLRRALQRQLRRDPRLQEPVRRAQALDRLGASVLVSEHAHIHAGMAQVRTGFDGGHGHKSDARILQVLRDGVAENGTHGPIHATHASCGHPSHPSPSALQSGASSEVLHRGDQPLHP